MSRVIASEKVSGPERTVDTQPADVLHPPSSPPLFELSWEQNREWRDCGVVTTLLREQVPVLDFVQWSVTEIQPGLTRSRLPLVPESTNQHCTHQAVLLALAGDYTGGIALASLFTGWPVLGVHPVSSPRSVALWLVKVEIRYLRPSIARLDVVAHVEPERHERIRKRFLQGKVVVESIAVQFLNGSVPVAEATLTYFARQSEKLRSEGASLDKVNVLFQHKLVSAAELIAGVRARENGGLFQCPYSFAIAGEHGIALAERFCMKSPQLGGMVAARTRDLDEKILAFSKGGGKVLILLGTGFDMRPFRLRLAPGTTVLELDYPTMLADRAQRLEELRIPNPPQIKRIGVPIDLRRGSLFCLLKELVPPADPVFIAWEGMSMYFEEPEVRCILAGIRPMLANAASRLWVDFADRSAVSTPDIFPEVRAFMDGMKMLGLRPTGTPSGSGVIDGRNSPLESVCARK